MKTQQKKDIEFELKPITTLPEQRKGKRIYTQNRYLTDGKYWDILHRMMREGKLTRYRILGTCDVEAPRRVKERIEHIKPLKYHLPNMRLIT